MKRKILALLLVVVLSVLCLASCEIIDKVGNKIDGAFNDVMDKIDGVINPNKPHEHTYATEWSKNDTHHWHAATCEHTDLKADEAEHAYVDGVCVCGATEPVAPHEHTYATEWSKNDTHHWHAATCEHTDLKADEAEHAYVEGVSVCGATEPVAP
ncbi:MAG: hypothetical protein IKC32_00775, partial [Clostridia bacterium]|nr:hypothetical protein [Clostridia bacterium]